MFNQKEYSKKYRLENKDKIKFYREKRKDKQKIYLKEYYQKNKEHFKRKAKKYREDHPEWKKKYDKEYAEKNKEKLRKRAKAYRKNNRERLNLYFKEKRTSDPIYRLQVNIRARIRIFLRNGFLNKNQKTVEFIGCTWEELKEHLEKQFKEGMSWDNYGMKGWHIDHIIPLYEAKTQEDVSKLCNYNNLQPLWAEENLKKNRY